MEAFVYGEMVKKMRKFHTLKGEEEQSYNPKLTAARVAMAKTESEIEKLLDTSSGANSLLLQYANTRIEEQDAPPGHFCPAGRKAPGTGCSNPTLQPLAKFVAKTKKAAPCKVLLMAQTVGFEPTWHCCQIDFELIFEKAIW